MRFVCNTIGQLIKKCYVHIMPHGYTHYVFISLNQNVDLERFDEKIHRQYDITYNRNIRARRKKSNSVDVRYIRYHRTAIIWIYPGNKEHEVFRREKHIRDIRQQRISMFGYTLGVTKTGRPELKLADQRYAKARRKLLKISYHDLEKVQRSFNAIAPIYKYRGVVRQLEAIRKDVNYSRAKVGLEPIQMK